MTPRQRRAARGTAAAAVSTIIAATSHTLAGDGAPPPALLAVVALLASPLAVAMAGRRLSPWRIGLTVLLSQALFHLAFVIAAGALDGAAPMAHMHHGTLAAAAGTTGPHLVGGLLPDGPMLIGHTLAALATTLGLLHGERMLVALGRGIRRVLMPVMHVVVLTPPSRQSRIFVAGLVQRPRAVPLSALSRRGPPAGFAAAV